MTALPPGVTEKDIAEDAARSTIELLEYLPDATLAEVYLAAEGEAYDRKLTTEDLRELVEE